MEIKTLTLQDRSGANVEYTITPLLPSRSIDLALNILACVAKPGARLVRLGIDAGEISVDDDTEKAAAFIGSIDWTQLADDAESTMRALAGQPEIVRRLFHGTIRSAGGRHFDLSRDVDFDAAYAGNWGELYATLKAIVEANGLLPFLDSLSS